LSSMFFLSSPRPLIFTLFPYTTLFRSPVADPGNFEIAAREPRRQRPDTARSPRVPRTSEEDVGGIRLLRRDCSPCRRARARGRADARGARGRLAEPPLALGAGIRRHPSLAALPAALVRLGHRRSLGPTRLADSL